MISLLALFEVMTPDPREHAVPGAVAAVTPEISSSANFSTENELVDLNNTRQSDSNGSDNVSNGSSDDVKRGRLYRKVLGCHLLHALKM